MTQKVVGWIDDTLEHEGTKLFRPGITLVLSDDDGFMQELAFTCDTAVDDQTSAQVILDMLKETFENGRFRKYDETSN